MTTTTAHPFLAQLLWPATSRPAQQAARAAVLVLAGAAAITLSAKTQIPFFPVPLTLQTMVVLLLAMSYGGKLAAATVVAYLAAGAAGLPVFAGTPEKGIGIAYLIGPTGGYLLGFLPAALLCAALARRGFDQSFVKTAAAMVGGNLIIYAAGLMWLGAVIGWDKPVLQLGLYPFIPGDLAKIVLATAVLPPLSNFLRKTK